MRNKLLFFIGFVFSFWFSCTTINMLSKLHIHTTMVDMVIDHPILHKATLPRVAATYTHKDFTCLRDNIFFEARNQSTLGMAMVGVVTIERTKMSNFPNTICGVVYETAQFSWTRHRPKPNMKNKVEYKAWKMCGLIAANLLLNSDGIDDIYKNVAYYHKTTIHPKWANSMRREFVVQDHVFYSEVSNEALGIVLR